MRRVTLNFGGSGPLVQLSFSRLWMYCRQQMQSYHGTISTVDSVRYYIVELPKVRQTFHFILLIKNFNLQHNCYYTYTASIII